MLGCFAITATFLLSFCPVLHCTSISNLIIAKTTNIRQSKGLASSFSRGEVHNTLSSLTAWILHYIKSNIFIGMSLALGIMQSTHTFSSRAFLENVKKKLHCSHCTYRGYISIGGLQKGGGVHSVCEITVSAILYYWISLECFVLIN